ncbi:MAG: AraC family transcriptional regulator [Oscillospiraceae bacterium]|nr:AraC family transcriptional regulator [Oscillospiraceae bacterium]
MAQLLQEYNMNDADGRLLYRLETYPLDSSWPFMPHTHPYLEISAVKSGSGTYVINGRRYAMAEGDVFLFDNREIHYITMEPNEKMTNVVVHFAPRFLWSPSGNEMDYDFLLPFFRRNAQFENRLDRDNPALAAVRQHIWDMEALTAQPDEFTPMELKIAMCRMLLDIRRHFPIVADTVQNAVNTAPHRMDQVYKYIDDNLENDIRLDALAKVACMSASYFSAYFKRHHGIGPVEFISRRRVQKAIELIRTTSDNFTEIYSRCGFNNSTSFLKTFKRITGNTPSFYRKK